MVSLKGQPRHFLNKLFLYAKLIIGDDLFLFGGTLPLGYWGTGEAGGGKLGQFDTVTLVY